jgi:hypothetical protein
MLSWLFKALVRPHLEYSHSVVHPRTFTQMKAVEAVQRRATKVLAELRDLPYHQRLKQLNLPWMQYHYRRGDMIELYRHTHKLARAPPGNISINLSDTNTRGHAFKFTKPRWRTTLRQKTFPHEPSKSGITCLTNLYKPLPSTLSRAV